ncbi:hypothetical protein D3C72_1755180 [compost metagenome]
MAEHQQAVGIDLSARQLSQSRRVVHQHAGVGGQHCRAGVSQTGAFLACFIHVDATGPARPVYKPQGRTQSGNFQGTQSLAGCNGHDRLFMVSERLKG